MKSYLLLFTFIAVLSCSSVPGATPETDAPKDGLTIEWDQSSVKILDSGGGYGRVHRLNDGRLMGVYSRVGSGQVIFSSDNGYNWTKSTVAIPKFTYNGVTVNIANSEFAQLSAKHPVHPGRIIYSVNLRPANQASTVYPYSIAYAFSDDNGQTWSDMHIAFHSDTWTSDVLKGCWEPFVLELPDGTVQIYFADETPYYRNGSSDQNISVIESFDGGDTWSTPRIAAYAGKSRDGMPVCLLMDGIIYMVVEHADPGTRLRPQVASNPANGSWAEPVLNGSPWRFEIFATPLASKTIYRGAPYLIRTDDYLVVSWQVCGTDTDRGDEAHAMMEVALCPISEMRDGKFTTMRGFSKPLHLDEASNKAKWNSLCDLGDNCVLAITSTKAGLVSIRGKILP